MRLGPSLERRRCLFCRFPLVFLGANTTASSPFAWCARCPVSVSLCVCVSACVCVRSCVCFLSPGVPSPRFSRRSVAPVVRHLPSRLSTKSRWTVKTVPWRMRFGSWSSEYLPAGWCQCHLSPLFFIFCRVAQPQAVRPIHFPLDRMHMYQLARR